MPFGDSKGFARAIRTLADLPEKRNALGQASLDSAIVKFGKIETLNYFGQDLHALGLLHSVDSVKSNTNTSALVLTLG
jgi:hypothetical protein